MEQIKYHEPTDKITLKKQNSKAKIIVKNIIFIVERCTNPSLNHTKTLLDFTEDNLFNLYGFLMYYKNYTKLKLTVFKLLDIIENNRKNFINIDASDNDYINEKIKSIKMLINDIQIGISNENNTKQVKKLVYINKWIIKEGMLYNDSIYKYDYVYGNEILLKFLRNTYKNIITDNILNEDGLYELITFEDVKLYKLHNNCDFVNDYGIYKLEYLIKPEFIIKKIISSFPKTQINTKLEPIKIIANVKNSDLVYAFTVNGNYLHNLFNKNDYKILIKTNKIKTIENIVKAITKLINGDLTYTASLININDVYYFIKLLKDLKIKLK